MYLTLNLNYRVLALLRFFSLAETLADTDLYVGDTHALARVDMYLGLNFFTDLHGHIQLA